MKKYKGLKEYKKLRNKLLKDKKVRAAYDELAPEFLVIREIIKQRLKKGLTQAKLAERIGTKQAAISRLESGTENPTLGLLVRISKALGKEIKVTIK